MAAIRVTPLASGSDGNCLLVEAVGVRLLIDAGLEVDEAERRLAVVGVPPRTLDAVFVTHRHRDHVRGATDLARRHRLRVFATRATARAIGTEVHRRLCRIEFGTPVAIDGLTIVAIPLPHDAPETAAVRVSAGGTSFGYATDLGRVPPGLPSRLGACDGVFLEFNHDRRMLLTGEDPPHLKRRIASGTGHLDNESAARLLRELRHPGLQHVWLGHVSRRNNTPELALGAARRALAGHPAVASVAAQDAPSPTVELSAFQAAG